MPKSSIIKFDKDNQEIFTRYCNEKNYFDLLKYFYKNHNKLCCGLCLCKIKDKEYGQHTNCEVCYIKDIKEEKRNKLKDNIRQLEELSNSINESINKMKIINEKINDKKEELKLKIQKIFTKIRNAINEREDKLLMKIDKHFDDVFIKEEVFKKYEKMPNKIKLSIENGKSLDKEWDNDNKLYLIINNCINIENNIKDIILINENIKKCYNINLNIEFYPAEENEINLFIEKILNFGEISFNNDFNIGKISKIIDNEKYVNDLKTWINPREDIKAELLYRLSDNGEKFSKFHELCDNKGSTLTLFHIKDGNKVGIYTPLSFDKNISGWKDDTETFIFNLNKCKIYKKTKNLGSLYCSSNFGIYTLGLGHYDDCKTMKRIKYYPNSINQYYENGSDILQSDNDRFYDLLEVEVFKISKGK